MIATRRSIALLVALIALTVPSAVRARTRDHNGGLFLRLSAGAGPAQTSVDADSSGKLKLSGATADINFAVGAIVRPNLALHATMFGWLISDPDAELRGQSGNASGDLDLAAFGGGVTYYIMPANLYLSGSVGAGTLSFDSNNVSVETDTGFVLDVSAGKEWWVGNRWGLGAAGAFGYHTIPDGGISENWSGTSFAVRFSATFN